MTDKARMMAELATGGAAALCVFAVAFGIVHAVAAIARLFT